tara:strand:- start:766 stop:873 length:108 start_codon:yes stop_codon:yes gene_type:complete
MLEKKDPDTFRGKDLEYMLVSFKKEQANTNLLLVC